MFQVNPKRWKTRGEITDGGKTLTESYRFLNGTHSSMMITLNKIENGSKI